MRGVFTVVEVVVLLTLLHPNIDQAGAVTAGGHTLARSRARTARRLAVLRITPHRLHRRAPVSFR